MAEYTNDEIFKVAGDKEVTVTATFLDSPDSDDITLMLNAAEAIKHYALTKQHKSWGKRINVTRKR